MIKKITYVLVALILVLNLGFIGTAKATTIYQPDHIATFRVEGDEGIINLQGEINQDSASVVHNAFKSFKDQNITHVIIHLHSLGGHVNSGMDIINDMLYARKHHILVATLVDHGEYCGSMCTVVFAAGGARISTMDTIWLFHAPYAKLTPEQENDPLILKQQQQMIKDYTNAILRIYALADKKFTNKVLKPYVTDPDNGNLIVSGQEIYDASESWITFAVLDHANSTSLDFLQRNFRFF